MGGIFQSLGISVNDKYGFLALTQVSWLYAEQFIVTMSFKKLDVWWPTERWTDGKNWHIKTDVHLKKTSALVIKGYLAKICTFYFCFKPLSFMHFLVELFTSNTLFACNKLFSLILYVVLGIYHKKFSFIWSTGFNFMFYQNWKNSP